jgi:hypothetical protein
MLGTRRYLELLNSLGQSGEVKLANVTLRRLSFNRKIHCKQSQITCNKRARDQIRIKQAMEVMLPCVCNGRTSTSTSGLHFSSFI